MEEGRGWRIEDGGWGKSGTLTIPFEQRIYSCAALLERSGSEAEIPTKKMKTTKIALLTLVAAALALALPARAETMSVPGKEKPAFTFDVPSDWKPTGSAEDESVEATAPGNHAYLVAWMVTAADEKSLGKDLEATLKDAMTSIDADTKQHELDQNGTHFFVFSGSGVDKRAGDKVKFLVGIFDAGGDKAGIVYADYDADAPAGTMDVLEGILKSIKVSKK
jgi:hypothetical protein